MHLLGTPYKGNDKSVILAVERPTTFIEEGLAVKQLTNVTIEAYNGESHPLGVMGGTEHKGASFVKAAEETFVQIDDGVEALAATDSVYVTAAGKFTNASEGNTQINAVFVADATGTFLFEDGVVTGANARTNQKCAMISFTGGF